MGEHLDADARGRLALKRDALWSRAGFDRVEGEGHGLSGLDAGDVEFGDFGLDLQGRRDSVPTVTFALAISPRLMSMLPTTPSAGAVIVESAICWSISDTAARAEEMPAR